MTETEHIKGLNESEVLERQQQGQINAVQTSITKTNWQIVKDNVFTLFNLFNLLIGIALAFVGAFMNMAYLLIIAVNIAIGIYQELHAKKLVSKLSLMNGQTAAVIRSGAETKIPVSQIVKDDVILLTEGSQVCADAVIIKGSVEVNESLLTGEADAVSKNGDGELLSGSFVVSGKCYARIKNVGAENFISKLAEGARQHKKVNSEFLSSMRKVTKFTSFFILPIGILLFIEAYFLRSAALADSIVPTAAALLGMLPKGLVLLISIALATGVVRLSKKRILVQGLHSLETLARIDVLCLDKTGTITEGELQVTGFNVLDKTVMPIDIRKALTAYTAESDDANATFIALKKYFVPEKSMRAVTQISFSSERKFSAISFEKFGTVIIGAPEKFYKSDRLMPKTITDAMSAGKRLLCVGFTTEMIAGSGFTLSVKVAAVIELSDKIRKDAKKTIEFFKRENVDVKIISGDNPITVSNAALQAGFDNYKSYVDMSKLETEKDIKEAAAKYSIFGRATPIQKKLLICAFKKQGHTVAMTGDGVNDVLALREADCGIAMSCGSDAPKHVSQLVLLDSDFTALPDAVKEGRRVVNNITRVVGVFFIKTIYSVLLSLLFLAMNVKFPFIPVQITLIDLAIEAYPALFMSFERSHERIKGSFLSIAIFNALPFAILILLNMLAVIILSKTTTLSDSDMITMMYFIIGFISLAAVIKTCIPFNKLRAFLCATSGIGFYVAIYLFSIILQIVLPSSQLLIYIAAFAAVSIPMLIVLIILLKKLSLEDKMKDLFKNKSKLHL